MSAAFTVPSYLAQALIALLCLGPIFGAFELAFAFLPADSAVIRYLHAASPLGKTLWLAAGPAGIAALVLSHRTVLAALAAVLFALLHVSGSLLVWRHFTYGCYGAVLAAVLAVLALVAACRARRAAANEAGGAGPPTNSMGMIRPPR